MPGIIINIRGNLDGSLAKSMKAATAVAQSEVQKQEARIRASQERIKKLEQKLSSSGVRGIADYEKEAKQKDALEKEAKRLKLREQLYQNHHKRVQQAAVAAANASGPMQLPGGTANQIAAAQKAQQTATIAAYQAKKAAIFAQAQSGYGATANAHYVAQRLARKQAAVAAATFIGPMASPSQLAQMAATAATAASNAGGKAAAGFWSKFAGNLKGHGSGGMAQLIHTFRASFDSLASGMSPWRVMLQQGPQALQAFASMGGSAAMKFIIGFGVVMASIGAIIASPFIYFARVDAIAKRLAGFELPDIRQDYISRIDIAANRWEKLARAIQDAKDQFNGAEESSKRALDALQANFQSEKELAELKKDQAIMLAYGDKTRIAAIEAKFNKDEVAREKKRAAEEKSIKQKEADGLQKEIDKRKKEADKITVGADDKHKSNLEAAKKAADAGQALLMEEEQNQSKRQDRWGITNTIRDAAGFWKDSVIGGGVFGGVQSAILERGGDKEKLAGARQAMADYRKLLDLEEKRNKKVEERNKLDSENQKDAARKATLDLEIAGFDKKEKEVTDRMEAVNKQKAENDRIKGLGGSTLVNNASVTDRERIGARSGSGIQATMLQVVQKNLVELGKHTKSLQDIERALAEGGY